MRENEELKAKNVNLESRLKCLNPVRVNEEQTLDQSVDPHVLEEWTTKLQLATECCEKVQQDMDKLKEVTVCVCDIKNKPTRLEYSFSG